jgi:hypothetical protein
MIAAQQVAMPRSVKAADEDVLADILRAALAFRVFLSLDLAESLLRAKFFAKVRYGSAVVDALFPSDRRPLADPFNAGGTPRMTTPDRALSIPDADLLDEISEAAFQLIPRAQFGGPSWREAITLAAWTYGERRTLRLFDPAEIARIAKLQSARPARG